ncbi:hypothetical protein [Natrarchaeobaculum sulfurireducens]|nr:hypothetical protein [Natrarchaeobaculum sulfurireducens]
MSDRKRDDLLIAVALTEFSVQYEGVDPELSRRAWLLAADRLLEYEVEPREAINCLDIGGSSNS